MLIGNIVNFSQRYIESILSFNPIIVPIIGSLIDFCTKPSKIDGIV